MVCHNPEGYISMYMLENSDNVMKLSCGNMTYMIYSYSLKALRLAIVYI